MSIAHPKEEDLPSLETYLDFSFATQATIPKTAPTIDTLTIAGLILLLFLGIQLLRDRAPSAHKGDQQVAKTTGTSSNPGWARRPVLAVSTIPSVDPATIITPYDEYWVSQGPHGYSYGHMAVDLVAGQGTAIKSPIQGVVSANFVDQYGNTWLEIENDRYRVTLLHGDYSVAVGQEVALGQEVGREANNGYTTDIYGNSCAGRDCGYHTHLNVFDRLLEQNVNPLDVLSPQPLN